MDEKVGGEDHNPTGAIMARSKRFMFMTQPREFEDTDGQSI